eukprot:3884520-Amphidinium_carterae.1
MKSNHVRGEGVAESRQQRQQQQTQQQGLACGRALTLVASSGRLGEVSKIRQTTPSLRALRA